MTNPAEKHLAVSTISVSKKVTLTLHVHIYGNNLKVQ